MEINWPKGQATFYKAIEKHREIILTDYIAYFDPASNDLGYATSIQGKIREVGSFRSVKGKIGVRLDSIHSYIKQLWQTPPAICFVEKQRPSMGNIYVTWGAAYCVGGARSEISIEVPCCIWQAYAVVAMPEDYRRVGRKFLKPAGRDDLDAQMMCEAILMLAREGVPCPSKTSGQGKNRRGSSKTK